MHRGHAVEQAGVGDLSSFHLPGHLFHEPVVLQLDQCRAIGTARYRIFHDRLAFELLRPWLVRVVDHPHGGMAHPVALMGVRVSSEHRGRNDKTDNENQRVDDEGRRKHVTEV